MACFHHEANALLSLSEKGEAQNKVSGLHEAVIYENVLVGAFRKENLTRFTMNGILN